MEDTKKMIENTDGDGGYFEYGRYKKGVCIKRYCGTGTRAAVPGSIDGMPVISIERKAFLSCKTLRTIVLPDTIEEIGDWAFAHAGALLSVTVPGHELTRGKELFLGCKRLREIIFARADAEKERELGICRMAAMAVTVLHDQVLFDPVGAGTQSWTARWDAKLTALIELDDLDGFEELWTCGEEDYEGKDYDIRSYPVEKRKMKLRLVYFRLLHPVWMTEDVRGRFMEYLRCHAKGAKTQEAWDIIIEEHRQELAYYQIFAEAGCVTADALDGLLADMEGVSAEIKAYLLRYKQEHLAPADAFAAFELDW